MDTNMYERQHGGDLEVGSYAHRAIIVEPDDIPSIAESALSPTELPFTEDDFELQMEQALELVPDILGDERVGIRHKINGLLSLTPDGMPILGETPEVKGLWVAAAVWIKEAPGIARMVAEWMTDGKPEIDPHGSDIARFHAHQTARAHVKARSAEGFNKTYGIVHPAEQWESNRDVRLSPFNARERELGAVFFETAGWERPFWYASNEALLEEYGDRVMPRAAEWESRWWSPIINAEHLAMRDRVGMVDLSAFAIFDISGPGALDHVQRMAVAQMDVPVGRVVYTPLLNEAGGIKSDLTIMRLGRDLFRVVTGGAHGMGDRKWFRDHLPADGSAQLYDATSTWCTAGIWGPRARDVVASATSDDVSNEGFPFGTCRTIELGGIPVLASRISYVGELGWELYVPMEQGARLWDTLWEAGRTARHRPVRDRRVRHDRAAGEGLSRPRRGAGARVRPGRGGHAPAQGQGGRVRRPGGLPRAALEAARGHAVHADRRRPDVVERVQALHARSRADPDDRRRADHRRQGPPLVRDQRRARGRRSASTSCCRYLPPEQAVVGTKLLVEYFGERYPVTVDVVGSTPLFDPENARVRA